MSLESKRFIRALGAALGLLTSLSLAACGGLSRQSVKSPAVAEPALGETAAGILAQAIRIRTPNPPGDERPLAEYFVSLLDQAGIEARVVPVPDDPDAGAAAKPESTRAAVWARLPGESGRPPLILLSHLDTVDAERIDWDYDPYGGQRVGDYVVGRGAIDAKGIGVVHLVTLIELARRGRRLDRDVILLATPDEETGGTRGAGYLTRVRRDLLGGAKYLLTEGGSVTLGRRGEAELWGVSVTEKSPCWMRLVARGRPGHSSVPPDGFDAAVPRLIAALERIRELTFPVDVVPEVEAMYAALARKAPADSAVAYRSLRHSLATDPAFRARFLSRSTNRAIVTDTLAITVLEGGPATNVMPSTAIAHLDSRVLPGHRCEHIMERVGASVAEFRVDVEPLLSFRALSSPTATPLYRAIENVAARADADSQVIPRVNPGFTDAHYFRELGIASYGFVPRWFHPSEPRGVHGRNERISVENLARGVETLIEILEELDRVESTARGAAAPRGRSSP